MPSGQVPGGSGEGSPEKIGPLSPFQQLKSIHFPQTGSFLQRFSVQFAGAAQYLTGDNEPATNVFLMAGSDIFRPTKKVLLGIATGFLIQVPMDGGFADIPATDNIWIGHVGGFNDDPQEFDGTFTCQLITDQVINGKTQPTKAQSFSFTTPQDLPGFTTTHGSGVSLGWLFTSGQNIVLPSLSNIATLPGARKSNPSDPFPFYAVWPLKFDFDKKQVSTSEGTIYREDQLLT